MSITPEITEVMTSALQKSPYREMPKYSSSQYPWSKAVSNKRLSSDQQSQILLLITFVKITIIQNCPTFGPLVPLFWISGDISSGFQSQSGFCLIPIAEANVMYIPWDPPLVLHLPTSWQPASQAVTSLHASAEVGRAITCTEDKCAMIVPATWLCLLVSLIIELMKVYGS